MEDKSKFFFTFLLLFVSGCALQSYLDYTDFKEPQRYLIMPLLITVFSIVIGLISKKDTVYKGMVIKLSIVCVVGLILWTVIIMYLMGLGKAYNH